WLFATGATLAATFVIALLASFLGLRAGARGPVRSHAVATPRITRRGPRTALVAAQVAITLVLAAGAGVFTRSLSAALSLNAPLDAARIVSADISLDAYGYPAERADAFFGELLGRLRANGSIDSVALSRSEGGRAA